MKLKAKFNVLHTDPGQAKPLLALLDGYGIRYKQGYKENVPHPKERWPIPAIDYAVRWAVRFRVPVALTADRTFVRRLSEFVVLDESDFEDCTGVLFGDEEGDEEDSP